MSDFREVLANMHDGERCKEHRRTCCIDCHNKAVEMHVYDIKKQNRMLKARLMRLENGQERRIV